MVILGKLTRNGCTVTPVTIEAMEKTDDLHKKFTTQQATFPHVMDGKHKDHSRHYIGLAFDLRRWLLNSIVDKFVEELREALGAHWDVIDEKTHIHVEYDPKF